MTVDLTRQDLIKIERELQQLEDNYILFDWEKKRYNELLSYLKEIQNRRSKNEQK